MEEHPSIAMTAETTIDPKTVAEVPMAGAETALAETSLRCSSPHAVAAGNYALVPEFAIMRF